MKDFKAFKAWFGEYHSIALENMLRQAVDDYAASLDHEELTDADMAAINNAMLHAEFDFKLEKYHEWLTAQL